jgi:hypothetical protein
VSKSYTVEAAEKTLPYVRSVVDEACEIYLEIKKKGDEHTQMDESLERERQDLRDEIRIGADRLRECCLEIEELDADLKDYEVGLVDFPAQLDGKEIYLSWKRDEERITHWYAQEDGFSDRKLIPEGCPEWPLTAASAARD